MCALELDGEHELRLVGVEQAWELDADRQTSTSRTTSSARRRGGFRH
jgi:hypothetical protein